MPQEQHDQQPEINAEAQEAEAIEPQTSEREELTPEAARAQLEKARKDAARYRQELRSAQEELERFTSERQEAERKRLEEAPLQERLEVLEREREGFAKRAEAAEAARVAAQRVAELTGKVADPKAALRLLEDDHVTEDGGVDVEALLAAYPFLAPRERPSAVTAGSAPAGPGRGYTEADLRRMTEAEINANWDAIKASMKRK